MILLLVNSLIQDVYSILKKGLLCSFLVTEYLYQLDFHVPFFLFVKLVTSFGSAIFSYSGAQSLFHINSPGSSVYIRKLASGLPGGTFLCSKNKAPRNIKLAQTPPTPCANLHLGRVEHRRFISCAHRN